MLSLYILLLVILLYLQKIPTYKVFSGIHNMLYPMKERKDFVNIQNL
jgi:hypothetical protein